MIIKIIQCVSLGLKHENRDLAVHAKKSFDYAKIGSGKGIVVLVA